MNNYIKKHTISDNGFITADSKKAAIVISLMNRVVMYGDGVYCNGKRLILFC